MYDNYVLETKNVYFNGVFFETVFFKIFKFSGITTWRVIQLLTWNLVRICKEYTYFCIRWTSKIEMGWFVLIWWIFFYTFFRWKSRFFVEKLHHFFNFRNFEILEVHRNEKYIFFKIPFGFFYFRHSFWILQCRQIENYFYRAHQKMTIDCKFFSDFLKYL